MKREREREEHTKLEQGELADTVGILNHGHCVIYAEVY